MLLPIVVPSQVRSSQLSLTSPSLLSELLLPPDVLSLPKEGATES